MDRKPLKDYLTAIEAALKRGDATNASDEQLAQ